jgi:putative transcriptional regulator
MIVVNLDVMMARRKMSLNELSEKAGVSATNLSILKTGKARAIRFSTLEQICRVLDCQPGDILEWNPEVPSPPEVPPPPEVPVSVEKEDKHE